MANYKVGDKVELHPDFAEWYGEIIKTIGRLKSSQDCAIYLINQMGFGHGLEDCNNKDVTEKYPELRKDMQDNKEKYTRAILDDNWTVRKEQLYYVELPQINDDNKFLNKDSESGELFVSDSIGWDSYKTKFTEKEIKAIDERYWSFAEPVEED